MPLRTIGTADYTYHVTYAGTCLKHGSLLRTHTFIRMRNVDKLHITVHNNNITEPPDISL